MDKFKALLEKYSQWVALSIGGFWLLYMLYAHVLASNMASVDVTGASSPLGPGSVDEFVKSNATDPLRNAMQGTITIKDTGMEFVPHIIDEITLSKKRIDNLGDTWADTPPVALTTQSGTKDPTVGPIQPVTALPIPPAAVNVDAEVGKSIITVAAAANGGANAQPVQQRQLWVTVFGTVPMAALKQAWITAGVDKLNMQAAQWTAFLKVEVIREELLPGGQFGNPVTIVSNPVDLGAQAQNAQAFPAWPTAGQTGPELNYRDMAQKNQKLVCQPGFFTVVKGDPWHLPGQVLPQVGVVAPPPDVIPVPQPPTNPRTGRPPVQPRPQPRSPQGPRQPFTPPPNGTMGPIDTPAAPHNVLQVFSDPGMPSMGRPNNGMSPTGPNGQPLPPAEPLPPANLIGEPPAGMFSPMNAQDVNLWVHDLTVVSGKTYRYSMRYTISNPVFTLRGFVPPANAAWATQFDLASVVSQPSAPVVIPDTTNFFVNFANPAKQEAKFDIFVWGVGGVVKTTATAMPGDMVDENLKLTLVDVREADHDQVVLLMDENGNLLRKSRKDDNKNPDYAKLLKEAGAP